MKPYGPELIAKLEGITDRTAAAMLNPYISVSGVHETLAHLAEATSMLALIVDDLALPCQLALVRFRLQLLAQLG
jgi:hypothetical protein